MCCEATITKRAVAWVGSVQPECTVSLSTWSFRNFKTEFLLNGKRPIFPHMWIWLARQELEVTQVVTIDFKVTPRAARTTILNFYFLTVTLMTETIYLTRLCQLPVRTLLKLDYLIIFVTSHILLFLIIFDAFFLSFFFLHNVQLYIRYSIYFRLRKQRDS